MSQNPRARKLSDSIRQILSKTLERGMKDPRLGFVTITEVRVTGDLQSASVFYTVYGDDEARKSTAQALASATGFLRSELGKNLNIRLVPTIEFILDALPETADSIAKLLAEARERDEAIAAQAKGASYAGEADPYLKADELAEDDETEASEDEVAEVANSEASVLAEDSTRLSDSSDSQGSAPESRQ